MFLIELKALDRLKKISFPSTTQRYHLSLRHRLYVNGRKPSKLFKPRSAESYCTKIIDSYNIYYFKSRFLAKYNAMPITDDTVAIADTLVPPIFSPHKQPEGRQLTACVISRQSFPAVTAWSISLVSRFFLASQASSALRQSLLHQLCRIERIVLEFKKKY